MSENTIAHNIRGMFDFSVERSLRLIYPLVSIEWVRNDISERTILTIGPRTEGEIYNLFSYGFKKKNVTGLDLITYSPMIQLGDMHAMAFSDESFDIVMAGWVIAYSDDKRCAANEILRVTKSGGLIAIGVEWTKLSFEEREALHGYTVGSVERITASEQILEYFGDGSDIWFFARTSDKLLLVMGATSCSCSERRSKCDYPAGANVASVVRFPVLIALYAT